ncbi:MAG: thioesterase family protein [Planctomycetota bacterium]|nr:thioesterase family protein [Planctomycetota bacterium]MDA1162901.1 thioesterase family protein [Planctomycetota bacterium]
MPAVFFWEHTVCEAEIDEQGHVNNLEYLRWMQSAAVAHSTEQHWPPERYVEEGSAFVVRSHAIEYLAPAYAGQTVIVETWVTGFQKVTSLRKYLIRRPDDGALLARAETNWAYIGRKHGVPRRIPQILIDSFEPVPDHG